MDYQTSNLAYHCYVLWHRFHYPISLCISNIGFGTPWIWAMFVPSFRSPFFLRLRCLRIRKITRTTVLTKITAARKVGGMVIQLLSFPPFASDWLPVLLAFVRMLCIHFEASSTVALWTTANILMQIVYASPGLRLVMVKSGSTIEVVLSMWFRVWSSCPSSHDISTALMTCGWIWYNMD